jgi:hypothetical protein
MLLQDSSWTPGSKTLWDDEGVLGKNTWNFPGARSYPEAFVLARLKPKPRLGAGAVALPEPDEEEFFVVEIHRN